MEFLLPSDGSTETVLSIGERIKKEKISEKRTVKRAHSLKMICLGGRGAVAPLLFGSLHLYYRHNGGVF
jgi:hypothetical protein